MIAHLHVHSHYSFFDSTLTPEEIPRLAVERGFAAVALTDTQSLAGAVAFYKACREHHVRPVLGAEVDDPRTGERAIILVRDWTGWGHLCRLLTDRHLQGHPEPEVAQDLSGAWVKGGRGDGGNGRLSISNFKFQRETRDGDMDGGGKQNEAGNETGEEFDLRAGLAQLPPDHTIVLTDSPELLAFLAPSRASLSIPGTPATGVNAHAKLKDCRDTVAPLYAELILTPHDPACRPRVRTTYEAARRLGLPIVATSNVHFAAPEDRDLHRLLQAIGRGSTLGRLDWDAPVPTREQATHSSLSIPNFPFSISSLPPGWFLDRCELRASWKGLRGEIERSIGAIIEACQFELPLGKWQLPLPHLPAGETPFSRLWKIAFAGLQHRYPTLTRDVIERLRHEIEIIDQLGFSNYFLVVGEIVEEARRRGLYVLGRGSAANSLVSYALGFTGVDPLRHHLYFERFLNPERGSPPDIDLDFSWKDRDAIVDWVFDRFGRDHVALISTTVRLQGRQAIREAAKAMGLADSRISRITRAIPFWYSRSMDLERLEETYPECRGLPLKEEPWRTILARAQRILGFPRHYGIHCGGVVITPEPIWRYVPLVRAAKGFVVTQMDMFPVEDLGLIKIDLLGNRSLGVYKDVLKSVWTVRGIADAAGEAVQSIP